MDRAITIKRQKLREKLPGALDAQPKLVWVQMIHRPFIKNHPYNTYNTVVQLRKNFNSLLEQESRKSMFALVLEMPNQSSNSNFFDSTGNLTYAGKVNYWMHIDSMIERFETGSTITLKPWMDSQENVTSSRNQQHGCPDTRTYQVKNPPWNYYHKKQRQGYDDTQANNRNKQSTEDIWGIAGQMAAKRYHKF